MYFLDKINLKSFSLNYFKNSSNWHYLSI